MNRQVLQTVFAPVLAVLSFIYALVMQVRAWLYRVTILASDTSGSFVVSIGNLQAGGTGKTPVTDFLAHRWQAKQRLGIVSRGYGRETRGSLRVDPKAVNAARKFGDEPTWLARDGVPVQVGERRIEAAHDLIAKEGLKLLLLDDGFQHLALRRSFDIVLMDVTAPAWHWRVLPWGRLREPFTALRRAEVVILTKCESVSEDMLTQFEQQIYRWAGRDRQFFSGATQTLPVLRFNQSLSWPDAKLGETLFLAAGLANPDAFFKMVRTAKTAPRVMGTKAYPDHYIFSEADVREIKSQAKTAGATRVLVTEKDAVKLAPLWQGQAQKRNDNDDIELAVSRLEVRPARGSDEKQLEHIDEIILDQVRGLPGRASGKRSQLPSRPPSA